MAQDRDPGTLPAFSTSYASHLSLPVLGGMIPDRDDCRGKSSLLTVIGSMEPCQLP